MKTIRLLLLGIASVLTAGCGDASSRSSTPDPADESGIRHVKIADLGVQVGEYLPPQEGGRLELAAPREWDWKRPANGRHLVGFVPSGQASLNSLPRILVQTEDAAGFSMVSVDEATLLDLVDEVRAELTATELDGAVRALVVDQIPCVTYTTHARRGNARVRRQVVQTLKDGRMYSVRLEAFDRIFPKYQNAAFAVIASMRFVEPAAEVPAAEVPAAEVPAGNPD